MQNLAPCFAGCKEYDLEKKNNLNRPQNYKICSSIDGILIALKAGSRRIGTPEKFYISNSYIEGKEQGGLQ